MKPLILLVILGLTCGVSNAAAPENVLVFRDAVLPGQCTLPNDPKRFDTRNGTLHQVPCRLVAQGQSDVFVMEAETGLTLLRFPELLFDPKIDQFGQPDWTAVSLKGVRTHSQLLEPQVLADAGIIRTSAPVPPGLGAGRIQADYRLEQDGPILESVAHISDTSVYSLFFPQSPSPRRATRRVAFNLSGFVAKPVDHFSSGSVIEILKQAKVPNYSGNREIDSDLNIIVTPYYNSLAIDIEDTGWADDSVSGRITRLLLSRDDGGWRVTDMGTVWVCWRGEKRLSTSTCP